MTHVRWFIRRDLPDVLAIEAKSFPLPWAEDDFLRCLRQRNCIGMAAERQDQIVGYMIYELHRGRIHLLNFAVCPEHRRSGVGAAMVAKLVKKLDTHRRDRITLVAGERNSAAHLFFRSQGFRAERVIRGYYDTGDDGYYFSYSLPGAATEAVELPPDRTSQYLEG